MAKNIVSIIYFHYGCMFQSPGLFILRIFYKNDMKLLILVVSLASCYSICEVKSWLSSSETHSYCSVFSGSHKIYRLFNICNTVYTCWKIKYINIYKYVCYKHKKNHVPARKHKNCFHSTQIICTEATCNLKNIWFLPSWNLILCI